MPLVSIDSQTAWHNIHSDKGAWSEDRLFPIAAPGFSNSFSINPGAKIFTIGSCFVRNIETHLVKAGFDNPAIRILGERNWVLNKYSPWSMSQDLKWAMGLERRPTLDERLIRVEGKGCSDCHLHWTVLVSEKEAVETINKAEQVFSEIFDSQVFILTLGLIEVWRDNMTGHIINEPWNQMRHAADAPEIMERFTKRFTFEVASFQETLDGTQELISLVKQASPSAKIVLTVSPVPLGGSFTNQDVMVANMYSKSTLRSVAEVICHSNDDVDYFPSFESVMLSDRKMAWESDNLHVRDEVVQFNVQRMLARYVEGYVT